MSYVKLHPGVRQGNGLIFATKKLIIYHCLGSNAIICPQRQCWSLISPFYREITLRGMRCLWGPPALLRHVHRARGMHSTPLSLQPCQISCDFANVSSPCAGHSHTHTHILHHCALCDTFIYAQRNLHLYKYIYTNKLTQLHIYLHIHTCTYAKYGQCWCWCLILGWVGLLLRNSQDNHPHPTQLQQPSFIL